MIYHQWSQNIQIITGQFLCSVHTHRADSRKFFVSPLSLSLFLSVSLDLWWVNFHLASRTDDIRYIWLFIGSKPDNYWHFSHSSKAPTGGRAVAVISLDGYVLNVLLNSLTPSGVSIYFRFKITNFPPLPRYRFGILSNFEMSQLRMNFNQFLPSQEPARLRERIYQVRLFLFGESNKYFSPGQTRTVDGWKTSQSWPLIKWP